MSETKFTKGPWLNCPAGIAGPDGYGLCVLWGEGDEKEANAHLIAAAPEMYAMLERIEEGGWDYRENGKMDEDVEKILAKARGES